MILTDEQVKEIKRRNDVERPTFYGATLENLTETAIALRAQLAELAAREVRLREVEKWARHLRLAASDFARATIPMLEVYDHEDDGCPEDDSCACPEFVKLREAATRMNKASENLDDALAAVAAARAGTP